MIKGNSVDENSDSLFGGIKLQYKYPIQYSDKLDYPIVAVTDLETRKDG